MRRMHVIACPSLRPALEALAAEAVTISLRFLEMGLHQQSAAALRNALQNAIDDIGNGDAIGVGYGLCNGGVVGLQARKLPVIIPRAHDCIGIVLGNGRYLAELEAHPGTYFQSAGWLENADSLRQPDFTYGPMSNVTRELLAERYGDDNADFLLERMNAFTRHYTRLAYITTQVAPEHEAQACDLARANGWTYERLEGDTGRLRRLLAGDWNEQEFLTVQPGQRVIATFDEHLIDAV
jgi:hypothetical protein